VRWKRSSVEQIVAILKPAEAGLPVADLIRWTRISEQTFYSWKKQNLPINSRLIKSWAPLAIYRTGAGWNRECSQRKYAPRKRLGS